MYMVEYQQYTQCVLFGRVLAQQHGFKAAQLFPYNWGEPEQAPTICSLYSGCSVNYTI